MKRTCLDVFSLKDFFVSQSLTTGARLCTILSAARDITLKAAGAVKTTARATALVSARAALAPPLLLLQIPTGARRGGTKQRLYLHARA